MKKAIYLVSIVILIIVTPKIVYAQSTIPGNASTAAFQYGGWNGAGGTTPCWCELVARSFSMHNIEIL